ncbi:MAG TPA: DUF2950 domain-containing protein [Steroidobacteraceae bacterium]|nr:DUF2950 domain-containing protein [Steroidobacteraceae bacterium]
MSGKAPGSIMAFTLRRSWIAALVAASMACALSISASAAPTGKAFSTPEKAVEALVGALRKYNPKTLLAIFGKGSEALYQSVDPVADEANRKGFLELYDAKHELVPGADESMVVTVGTDPWPMPIPLVKTKQGWAFDTAAGMDEILDRRIGRNELSTIQACLTIVDAEREYYAHDRDGDGILEYAQAFRSVVGRHNGLFWPAEEGEPESPLGELVAQAAAEGYEAPIAAFHGYHYKLLTAQGPAAKGGAYSYLAGDNQIGGFAVIAYPAAYGELGIMSFIVNQEGVVYQRDLGAETEAQASKITTFDPVEGWTPVPEKDRAPLPAPED